ncbi:MAG TPA: FAD-binding oxidoreductase [Pyrinomonadaceae bacterium]|nr:FAD-binding oxidoreductase [Pyrinomonadaceae bacterium]
MQELNIKGIVIRHSDRGFEEAILKTLFNKRQLDRMPLMMVVPETVDEIIATIKYAKSIGKRISICSGGHSWSANHVRNDSILINMSKFNSYEINKESMTAVAGPAVGGSILLTELFKQDLFFPAGHCKGVCIGGYLLQGGFALNGRKLGLACESVLGIDLVTADGEYLHASETENSDLFWAARGSGGGFFGVIVRFHLKLYSRPKFSGSLMHVFSMKYLEDVFNWAYEVGPSVSPAVEFQLLMTRKTLKFLTPGIEVVVPIFADSEDELYEAKAFMENSPIKNKAYFRAPYLSTGVKLMYRFAMVHYPENHCWGVDNMWTNATISELMPFIKEISVTLPPPPSHFLWLNWQPPKRKTKMSFSMEDKLYLALYGAWKNPSETLKYGNWATDLAKKYSHLETGIQLADESLHTRTAKFVSDENLQKLNLIRGKRDEDSLFHEWHSKPKIG